MKITRISVYQVDLPMKEGSYSWSTQSFSAFDSTVVIVETNSGVTGAGESCPLGPSYLPAYAEGARAGLAKLAPNLIGANPLELGNINDRMDTLLKGHPYVKSAIDMACWDILGKRLASQSTHSSAASVRKTSNCSKSSVGRTLMRWQQNFAIIKIRDLPNFK